VSIDDFIAYISESISLSYVEESKIRNALRVIYIKAGRHLLKQEMVSSHSYFILKGCIRQYYIKSEGTEITTFFYTENDFVTSLRSLTAKTPSKHNWQCVEDCTLIEISIEVENLLFQEIPKLEKFARLNLEKQIAIYQEMLSQYVLQSPEDRYLGLMQSNPDLIQRVPQY